MNSPVNRTFPNNGSLSNSLAWNLFPWRNQDPAPSLPAVQHITVTPAPEKEIPEPAAIHPTDSDKPTESRTISTQTPSDEQLLSPEDAPPPSKKVRVLETPKLPPMKGCSVRITPLKITRKIPARRCPTFLIDYGRLETLLTTLICRDTHNFADNMKVLSCEHVISTQASAPPLRGSNEPLHFRCNANGCGVESTLQDLKNVTRKEKIKALVRQVFNPHPALPDFTAGDAQRLFENFCSTLYLQTAPITAPTEGQDKTCLQRIIAAVEVTKGTLPSSSGKFSQVIPAPVEEHAPRVPTPSSNIENQDNTDPDRPPSAPMPAIVPQPSVAPKSQASMPVRKPKVADKDASSPPCLYVVKTDTRTHFKKLPGTHTPGGRLMVVYDFPMHQAHCRMTGTLHFVEYLPNNRRGQELAEKLKLAAIRGIRFTLSQKQAFYTINWNRNIPPWTQPDNTYPSEHMKRVRKALKRYQL